MANVISQIVMGTVVAGTIGGSAVMYPVHKPYNDVAFLERVATRVERVKIVAPEPRDYLSRLALRYEAPLSDPRLELRKQQAIARILAAGRPAD